MTELGARGRFRAVDRTARPLGTFPSLDQAMAAIERDR